MLFLLKNTCMKLYLKHFALPSPPEKKVLFFETFPTWLKKCPASAGPPAGSNYNKLYNAKS
jgi:hypothetical protein